MREPIRLLRGIHYGVSGPARTPGLLLVLVAALFVPRQVLAQKMYWTDTTDDKIQRANLDGTSVENVITAGLTAASYIAIDRAGGKIYWTDAGLDKIVRANLDGTGVLDLITTGLTVLSCDVRCGSISQTGAGKYIGTISQGQVGVYAGTGSASVKIDDFGGTKGTFYFSWPTRKI